MTGYTVYPRVGGGTLIMSSNHRRSMGLSPRGRGTFTKSDCFGGLRGLSPRGRGTLSGDEALKAVLGLSPRGRGNLLFKRVGILNNGSIPAWAGEPDTGNADRGACEVYPRVGGGTLSAC